MMWAKVKIPACLFTAILTGIAVTTGLFVTVVQPVQAAFYTGGESGYGKLDNHITTPSEEPALFRKTAGSRLMPLRAGFQRTFGHCGIHGTAYTFCMSLVEIISNTGYTLIKKPILLKLRI